MGETKFKIAKINGCQNCGIAGGRNNNYLDLKEQEKFLTGLQKETIIAHNIDKRI